MDWFRSWHGAPTDNKWLVIARRANVNPGMVSAVFWALMDYASQQHERGSVAGFDVESYSFWAGWTEAEILSIIEAMRVKGVVTDGDTLSAWDKRQPKREDDSKERVRAYRDRNVTQRNADVTQSNASGDTVTTDKRRVDKRRVDKKRTEKNLTSSDEDVTKSIPNSDGDVTQKLRVTGALSQQQEMFGALIEVCVLDSTLHAKTVGKMATQLLSAGYTPDQVKAFPDWWKKDWRGIKGATPTLRQVNELIKQSLTYTNGNGNGSTVEEDPGGWNALGKEQERVIRENAHLYEDVEIPF